MTRRIRLEPGPVSPLALAVFRRRPITAEAGPLVACLAPALDQHLRSRLLEELPPTLNALDLFSQPAWASVESALLATGPATAVEITEEQLVSIFGLALDHLASTSGGYLLPMLSRAWPQLERVLSPGQRERCWRIASLHHLAEPLFGAPRTE